MSLRAVDIERLRQRQGGVGIHVEAFCKIVNQEIISIGAKPGAADTGFELLAPVIGARGHCFREAECEVSTSISLEI